MRQTPVFPLSFPDVLEDEFATIDGKAPGKRPGPSITKDQVVDLSSCRVTLQSYGLGDHQTEDAVADVLEQLRVETAGERCPATVFRDSPQLGHNTSELLRAYERFDEERKQTINRCVIDDVLGDGIVRYRDVRLSELYGDLHGRSPDESRTALCLSGGGIRSATFGLGVLQALAGRGVLKHFDYLSTVSGGGYIGSWLSSWARRHPGGIAGVERDLATTAPDTCEEPADGAGTGEPAREPDPQPRVIAKIEPEAKPIRHLREYSNYLTPRVGILSGDTWAFVALYLRNLLLNLAVLVPILAFAVAAPRILRWLVSVVETRGDLMTPLLLSVVSIAALCGYIGAARPVRHGSAGARLSRAMETVTPRTRYFLFSIVAGLGASTGLTLFWVKWASLQRGGRLTDADYLAASMALVAAAFAATVLPWAIYARRFLRATAERRAVAGRLAIELGAAIVGALVGGAIYVWLAVNIFDDPSGKLLPIAGLTPFLRAVTPAVSHGLLFVWLAPAAVALVLFVQATVFVAVSGKFNEDYDREWWARIGAWLLSGSVVWIVVAGVSIFGPLAIYHAPAIVSMLGSASGVIAMALGYSARTKANNQREESGPVSRKILAVTVLLFSLFLLAAISWLTTLVIQRVDGLRPPDVRTSAQLRSVVTAPDRRVPGYEGFNEIRRTDPAAYASPELVAANAHLRTIEATSGMDVLSLFLLAAAAAFASRAVGVNRFSMHALYKNRLIRAYLGASRYDRRPEPITGFDGDDNVRMYRLRPELLWLSSFRELEPFIADLRASVNNEVPKVPLSSTIAGKLRARTREMLRTTKAGAVSRANRDALIIDINRILETENLLEASSAPLTSLQRMENRRVFDEAYAEWVTAMAWRQRGDARETNAADGARLAARQPLHVINAALNLVSGEKLAWQQRRAESFTISPLHCGSVFLGYRDSREYGAIRDGISLGTAMTISGAAASPNQGYHSSTALAFLMTMFNVRLGWWLSNPGAAGRRDDREPTSNLALLAREMLTATNERSRWVYLSDGGHFDNLGIYEMVLRRCRYIVAIDSGCDPRLSFEDLGNAIRKIRTDLGIPIEFGEMPMRLRDEDDPWNYAAIGEIRYAAVDATDAPPGKLVYIKPGYYLDEKLPKDVVNYGRERLEFPHEATADQWFTESQFESYRMLGQHAVDHICRRRMQFPSVAAFVDAVAAELRAEVGRRPRFVPVLTKQARLLRLKPQTLPPFSPRSGG